MAGRALILVENLSVPFDRRVWQEGTALRDAGWEVHIICPQGVKQDTESEVVIDGVHILRYPLRAADGGPLGYLWEYSTALWHTFRLASRVGRVDVIHACNPPDLLFLVAWMLRRHGARFIFDQHDLVPELYLSRFGRGEDLLYRVVCGLERASYRAADVVIATNESYRQVALSRGSKRPDQVFVVRSAPAMERFRQVAPDPSIKRGKAYLLCYLGVMGPQDGVDYALRSLVTLRNELGRSDWRAVFVGSGDVFNSMVALASRLGLSDCVEFTGRVHDADLLRYLSTADVCLAPDPRSPLNDVSTMNKIMEYMAMARPIVSFDLRETRVSAGDAALFAPANDERAFARLVARLLDDPKERHRMGAVGHARVTGPLSWEHSRATLLAAYETVRHRRERIAPMTPSRTPMLRALRKPAHWLSRWSRKRKLRTLLTVIEPGASVLLVGVSPGTGIGTESLVENGLAKHANVVGLVYSPVTSPVLGTATVRGDGRALPFATNSFDYVVSNAVIEHVGGRDGASRMLLEGDRVARRGWIHTTPNRRFPIEVHTGVPVLHWLPRGARERAFSSVGITFSDENYHLFTARSLRQLGIPAITRVASRVGVAMTLFVMNPELGRRLGNRS